MHDHVCKSVLMLDSKSKGPVYVVTFHENKLLQNIACVHKKMCRWYYS